VPDKHVIDLLSPLIRHAEELAIDSEMEVARLGLITLTPQQLTQLETVRQAMADTLFELRLRTHPKLAPLWINSRHIENNEVDAFTRATDDPTAAHAT